MKRRLQTRAMFTEAVWRLRNQSPDLIIDEYVGKVQKLVARPGSVVETERTIATRASQKLFWETQREALGDPSKKRRESRGVSRGAKVMGWGLLVGAVGGVVVLAGEFGGVFVMTAGAILIVVGLIMVIVSGISSAAKSNN